jgi:hypothetical protein
MGAFDLLQHLRGAGFHLAVAEDKLLVTPASTLTEADCAAIRASKPELIELLTRPPAHQHGLAIRTCTDCQHFGRRRTCLAPVAAGLVASFEIEWPPEGYGAGCAAFKETPT